MPTDVPTALRRDVRLLSTALGRVLEETEGPELLQDVERLRHATIAARRANAGPAALEAPVRIAGAFEPGRAEQVARAFTCYFQLANLAEERQRIRSLRERGPDVADSVAAGVAEAGRELGADALAGLVGGLRVTPVLTAHPTEARRRATLETLWRVSALLDRLDDPHLLPGEREDDDRRLMEEVVSLWRTDPVRRHRPQPLDEVRAAMALFDQTIFRVAPLVCRSLDRSLAPGSGERPPAFSDPPLRWGSWIGADRDGNPHVTSVTTVSAAAIASEHLLLGLEAASRRIARSLAVSDRDAPASADLQVCLRRDEELFPRVASRLARTLPDAPHRRALVMAAERLAASRTRGAGSYPDPAAFLDDLRTLQRSLADAGLARLAFGELQHLVWQAEIFGFHLAMLEVRQHAKIHAETLRELGHDPEDTVALDRLAFGGASGSPVDLDGLSSGARETVQTLRAIRDIQARFGPESAGRYVVSFTHSPADVLAVYALGRLAVPDGGLTLDVVPLLESRRDLDGATPLLDRLIKLPGFSEHLAARERRMEVMLGYSDSAKEIGVLAANITLFRAQGDLAAWAAWNHVTLTLFHGRGGALGRGGGPTNRAIFGQAAGSVAGRVKVTEQGEVAFARYGNLRVAQRHLEQLTNASLVASTPAHDRATAAAWDRFHDDAGLMAAASEQAYRELVEHPEFVDLFLRITPMDEIGALTLGSRPARRGNQGARGSQDLRAIPWVFAWGQSRINLPGWFGVGSGLAAVAGPGPQGRAAGIKRLRAMRSQWPFFASFLENVELSLAKADMTIGERYAGLAPAHMLWDRIRTEFELTRSLTLAVTGGSEPLTDRPALRRAIDLRNPYVDALSLLQVRTLTELRAGVADAERRAELERLAAITISGVAAGLQNTG
ncbi:MAG: phosphoenolpyruvate carboxylase [Actinomycetota bacterium]|jgi:phosphoenolpyruvate carboxylase|nr:phosphoenolpyruvate carboxylase [Actinomycetota bacterium]